MIKFKKYMYAKYSKNFKNVLKTLIFCRSKKKWKIQIMSRIYSVGYKILTR